MPCSKKKISGGIYVDSWWSVVVHSHKYECRSSCCCKKKNQLKNKMKILFRNSLYCASMFSAAWQSWMTACSQLKLPVMCTGKVEAPHPLATQLHVTKLVQTIQGFALRFKTVYKTSTIIKGFLIHLTRKNQINLNWQRLDERRVCRRNFKDG